MENQMEKLSMINIINIMKNMNIRWRWLVAQAAKHTTYTIKYRHGLQAGAGVGALSKPARGQYLLTVDCKRHTKK
jgi:hypothetical protein